MRHNRYRGSIAHDIQMTTQFISSDIQNLAAFEHPHQDYMNLASRLQILVEGLEKMDGDGMLQRSWKNLRFVRQKNEIIEICETLCWKGSFMMMMWLVAINM